MNGQGGIPRSRGGICGLLLILLGAWGGLAPFVGPYFHFGYSPDKAWAYTSGRLYFSIVPGAAALLGGLIVAGTRNRGFGALGGLLAAVGGAWFLVGSSFTTVVLKRSISLGQPIPDASGPLSAAVRSYLESVALFSGTGILVLFCGALAIGRFSMIAARDLPADADAYYSDFPAGPAGFPATTGPLNGATDQFPTATSQASATTGQFPAVQPSAPPPPFSEPARYPGSAQYPDPGSGPFPPQQSASS